MSLADLETRMKRFGLDFYMLLLLATVLLSSLFPSQGAFAGILSQVAFWAVALLFFLYGVKLPGAEILKGFANWRLQIGCILATFLLFPLLTLGLARLSDLFLPALVGLGFLYLGCLPSTVQSSIAFTSVSGGNVAGAVTAASVSNLAGVIITPVLFSLIVTDSHLGNFGAETFWKLGQQILAPFVLGQLLRPLLAERLAKHKKLIGYVDRGTILLIVHVAFSAGVTAGIWQLMGVESILAVIGFCLGLFALVAGAMLLGGRAAGMPRADLVALFYCGSTKSLASGLPMAKVLFPAADVALIVLPLMLFHMLQLLICAALSQRWKPAG